jgi:hypothetical protein
MEAIKSDSITGRKPPESIEAKAVTTNYASHVNQRGHAAPCMKIGQGLESPHT